MMNLLKSQGAAASLAISSLILLVVLARVTGPQTFAFYSVVVAYTSAFAKIAGLNVYFFYRHKLALASPIEQIAIFRSYANPVLAVGFVAVLGLAAATLLMRRPDWIESPVEVILLAVLALLSLRNLEVIRFYHATARFTFATLAQAAVKLLTVAFVAIAANYGFSQDRASLLGILTVSAAALALAQALWDREFFSRWPSSRYSFNNKSLTEGIGLLSPVLFGEALVVADRSFLAASTDASTVAQYSLASQGIFLAYGVLGGSLISYFYPHVARSYHSDDLVAARASCLRLIYTGVGSSLMIPPAIWLAAPAIPMFLGSEYLRTGEILLTMSLLPLLLFFSSCVIHALYVLERVAVSVWIHGVALIFHVAATFMLTNFLGVEGAITALYASLILTAVAHAIALFLLFPRRTDC